MSNTSDEIPDTGAVFTFGKSRFADNEPSHFFIKNDPIIAIACGDEHSAVICQQGRVFVFGGNSYGQLGLGHNDEVTRPSCVKWLKPQKALFVACGRAHTIFVTDTFAIYTVGNNSDGQLGTGNTDHQSVPQYVDLECDDNRIKQVSAGSSHTVILTEGGKVFVCGSNTEGQLGLGEDVKMSSTLTELKFMERIAFVECGYYHTVFITSNGVVFITGENEGQKIGIQTPSNVYIPQVLPIETSIKSACCGASNTFLLSLDETKVFALGSNEKGQLGLPKAIVEVTVPTELSLDMMFDGNQLKLIACGGTHTAFLTENGLLYMCGEARHNKLCLDHNSNDTGDESMPNQYTPKRVVALNGFIVDNVACGGCHTLMTATKDMNFIEIDRSRKSSIIPTKIPTELPPLQNTPGMMLQKMGAKSNREADDEASDKSANSMEANVSETHISTINELVNKADEDLINGFDSIKDSVSDTINKTKDSVAETIKNVKDETMKAVENVKNSTIEGVQDVKEQLCIKETKIHPGDICNETNKTFNIQSKKDDIQNSPLTKSSVELQIPMSHIHKDGDSQESETLSKSENETLTCDSGKSSPPGKTKTQAVLPIVRSEDSIAGMAETAHSIHAGDDSEVVVNKGTKGRFTKILQNLRDKENSCMGKGKVIENVAVDNVNKGITTAEETVHKMEETITNQIRNQTNSRACVIL